MFTSFFIKTAQAAAGDGNTVDTLIQKLNEQILNPLVGFMFVLAFLFFVYGVLEFAGSGATDQKREEGKKHLMWGLAGLVIMFSVFGLMRFICSVIGVTCQ